MAYKLIFQRALPLALSLVITSTYVPAMAQANDHFGTFNPTILNGPEEATANNLTSDIKRLFELTDKIMTHKVLYKFLNEVFEPLLVITPDLQQTYGWPEKSKGLSETQVLFLLQEMPDYWKLLEEYLGKVTLENFEQEEIKEIRESMRKRFRELVAQDHIVARMQKLVSPTEPLALVSPEKGMGFSDMKAFINHPTMDPTTNKILNKGTDLKSLVIEFIKGAKESITFNVFEFNLPDVAEAMLVANKNGVKVAGGIDAKTVDLSPANKSVFETLKAAGSSSFQVEAIDAVGLNHQKVIVRDAGTPNARVLFLSGNFTQSCIGPEGDAVALPPSKRPRESIPNANHAILIKGELPALIAERELNKTIFKKYRGQSGYPISGSYIVFGPGQSGQNRSYLVMAFSPNGGMGEVNRDIMKRTVLSTKGSIWAMHFAFSSPEIVSAIESRILKGEGKVQFRGVGDPPFAMREWSGFLKLSGLNKNMETLKYEAAPDFALGQKSEVRVNPKMFSEFHREVEGQNYKLSAKLHHKVFIFPQDNMAIAGTSFNPSNNAESNQEQILVISDKSVVRELMGGFHYLFRTSPMTVGQYAKIRNQRNIIEKDPSGLEAEFVRSSNKKPEAVTSAPACAGVL